MTTVSILAVHGASNRTIQGLLRTAAKRWAVDGARVVGVVETADCGVRRQLQDLAGGTVYELDQELGPGSRACRLVGSGVAEACEALCRQIRSGCDLVVLNKFGKLEAERSGLLAAFAAAVEMERPILTAVSPALVPQWRRFAGGLAAFAPASPVALDAWWQGLRTSPQPTLRDVLPPLVVEREPIRLTESRAS